jgi:adenylate cyclase class 2
MNEVEVKARVSSFEELQSRLRALGCIFADPRIQHDRIYLHSSLEFSDKTVGTLYLRIRDSNGKHVFTLKKQLATEAENIEKELVIDNPETCSDILMLMGYHEVLQISKQRVVCKYDGMEICLDTVERLGTFIEVEKMTPDEDTRAVKDELCAFLQTLGVAAEDYEPKGYATLLYELKNK